MFSVAHLRDATGKHSGHCGRGRHFVPLFIRRTILIGRLVGIGMSDLPIIALSARLSARPMILAIGGVAPDIAGGVGTRPSLSCDFHVAKGTFKITET